MKKIFTSIAVVAACAVGAFAQKNADLSIRFISPSNGANLPNKTVGGDDSIRFFFEVTNAGPDNFTATDTFEFGMLIGGRNMSTNGRVWLPIGGPAGFTLPAGTTDTLNIMFRQNALLGTIEGTEVRINWPSNAADTFLIDVVAKDAGNDYFDDPGTDGFGGTDNTGNNVDGIAVQFGSVGIKDLIAGANKEALSVYPNPTKGDLKFDYDFKNATDASIRVTDIAGRVVYTQALGKQAAGKQAFNINLGNLANGMYTIELNAGENRATSQFNINK